MSPRDRPYLDDKGNPQILAEPLPAQPLYMIELSVANRSTLIEHRMIDSNATVPNKQMREHFLYATALETPHNN